MSRGRKAVKPAGDGAVTHAPEPPAWLCDHGKEEWRRVLPILIGRRAVTPADLFAVESYCAAVGLARRAQIEAAGAAVVVTAKNGVSRANPAIQVARNATNDARKLAGELGLTPASRHLRGGADPEPPADDEDDDFTELDLGE